MDDDRSEIREFIRDACLLHRFGGEDATEFSKFVLERTNGRQIGPSTELREEILRLAIEFRGLLRGERLFQCVETELDRVIRVCCRNLSKEDREDFSQDLKLKWTETDYLPLRRFRGSSPRAHRSFLVRMVKNAFIDWSRRMGRMRRSTSLKSQLEELVFDFGSKRDEAFTILRMDGYSKEELDKAWGKIRPRPTICPLPLDNWQGSVETPEERFERKALEEQANQWLQSLAADDQLILRLLGSGKKIPEIAKLMGVPYRSTWRRIQRLRRDFGRLL